LLKNAYRVTGGWHKAIKAAMLWRKKIHREGEEGKEVENKVRICSKSL
jgi:hypothetical protein